ncbi:hypothetical protein F5B20DRAFT_148898 [Whalleya microplaca]|nr:hypothetical protein F5B20DRAFT_148898 [Whalleya microplaca]
MEAQNHIYVRFGTIRCIRLSAVGSGIIADDGLKLFEWIRNPGNIARLRKGLGYVYEVGEEDLHFFLAWAIIEQKLDVGQRMEYCKSGEQMIETYQRYHKRFIGLKTGVEKLEAIASAQKIMTIPKTASRSRSDASGWLYLINLDRNTLEVYQPKGYRIHKKPTNATSLRGCPDEPPGYYIKFSIPELQGMWRDDWIKRHQSHEVALGELWKQRSRVRRGVSYARDLPFSLLYSGVFHGRSSNQRSRRQSARLTVAKLVGASSTALSQKP